MTTSIKKLGLEMEKKFKQASHYYVMEDGKEISLIGFVNFQFGIDEYSFNRPDKNEESDLWNMINEYA